MVIKTNMLKLLIPKPINEHHMEAAVVMTKSIEKQVKKPMDTLLSIFKKPASSAIARDDLEEAKCLLLKHEAAATYHTKMTEYYQESIRRLALRVKGS